MQSPTPMEQSPIVTLSNKHLQSQQSIHYQPILYGSTSVVDNVSPYFPQPTSKSIPIPKLTTTFSITPASPGSGSPTTSDPLPLLLQGHNNRDSITTSPVGGAADAVQNTFGSINSLDSYTSDNNQIRSRTKSNSSQNSNSFRAKFLRKFSRNNSNNNNKKIQVSTSASGEDGTHTNPMFDYENLDQAEDVHNEELTTPVPTPEPPKLEQQISDNSTNMFDINLDNNHDHHEHHAHAHHDHDHNHTHSHPPHLNRMDSRFVIDPSSGDPPHCHDQQLDQMMAHQTRRAIVKLILGLILCFAFMIVELVGGYLSKSLAIFTDAAHLTSDLVSFGISLAAIFLGQQRPTQAKSFGYYRFEVLGVLVSVFSIWFITGLLIYLAMHRIVHQDFEIESQAMLIVSSIGLGMNLLMMFVLADGLGHCWDAFVGFCVPRKMKSSKSHVKLDQSEPQTPGVMVEEGKKVGNGHGMGHSHGHGHSHGMGHGHSHMNMNVRAALLHIVGDIIQSIGVLIASIVIHIWPHLKLADPICTLIFGVIVFLTTYQILSDALHILMEGFPREFQYDSVRQLLLDRLPSAVVHVHSLHIWSLTHGRNALTVHITVDREKLFGDSGFEQVRQCAEKVIRAELGISQTTIQVEYHQPLMVDSCDTCIGPKK